VKRALIDSGAWFAHLVAEDTNHEAASRLFQQARNERWSLVTTNAIVYEAHALILNRAREGRSLALGFLESLESGVATVVRVTRRDEERAMKLLRAQPDKSYSLCDALSFVVMERLRIKDAIAFDRHFRQYGRFNLPA
jgi:predicted nucleic acid-binding protein